jgi:putative NADH-flavin reductase
MEEILVLGAAGGIGRQAVEAALSEGWRVIAVLRTPAKLPVTHPLLTIVKGDILDPASYEPYLSAGTVVLSAIGVSGGLGGDKPTTLYSEGARRVLEAMGRRGTSRVFFISASALEISPVLPALVRFAAKYILQKLLRHMYADLRVMEGRVKESGKDWTIIRPPRLTNAAMTGRYRFAVNSFLRNSLSISRADVAHFALHHAKDRGTCQGVVEVGY